MKILLIGGTRFVGRYLVEDLLRRGHELTLFHRGETNPGLFPEVDRVLGDRRSDLHRVGDRSWDVVIDTCGYAPEDVQPTVEQFADRAGRYVFISSVAVYQPTTTVGIDEGWPVQDGPEPSDPVAWWHTEYDRNKVQCERRVLDAFGPSRALIIRPGMIMGPHDPPWERLPYWLPSPEVHGYCGMDNSKAVELGLTFRPLAQSAEDVRAWYSSGDFAQRDGWIAGSPPSRGLSPDLEASLLRAYS